MTCMIQVVGVTPANHVVDVITRSTSNATVFTETSSQQVITCPKRNELRMKFMRINRYHGVWLMSPVPTEYLRVC